MLGTECSAKSISAFVQNGLQYMHTWFIKKLENQLFAKLSHAYAMLYFMLSPKDLSDIAMKISIQDNKISA